MRKIRVSVALLLLMSMILSACSGEETVETETSETTEVIESAGDRNYLVDELSDVQISAYYDTEDDWVTDYTVPSDAFDFVVDSILNYIDKNADSYIGWTEDSGIDEFMENGGTKDELAAAYVDANYDGVAELAILDLTDRYGYAILEFYSYDSTYGLHPIVHGNSQCKYYLDTYADLYCYSTEPGREYIGEYWFNSNCTLTMGSAYYLVEIGGVKHLCMTWDEEYLFSDDITDNNILDYGSLNDTWNQDTYNSAYRDFADYPYSYDEIISLSSYNI